MFTWIIIAQNISDVKSSCGNNRKKQDALVILWNICGLLVKNTLDIHAGWCYILK